jgi:hypothetical protein
MRNGFPLGRGWLQSGYEAASEVLFVSATQSIFCFTVLRQMTIKMLLVSPHKPCPNVISMRGQKVLPPRRRSAGMGAT